MASTIDPPLRLDGTHHVLTPEFVEFNFVLAGLMSRFLALMIDTAVSIFITLGLALVMFVLSALATAGGMAIGGVEFGDAIGGLGVAAFFVVRFLVDWGYMTLLESLWSGQTIGKKAMGLRVIQDTGVRVGVTQSLLRNLVRPVDSLSFMFPPPFYVLGGLTALFSSSHQRLGDLVAGTVVVRERRLKIPSHLERPEGDTSLLADPDFRARVAKLTAEDENILFSAAVRREELGIEARLSLFATLGRRLEEDLGFTKPQHLSDEKLVLLVTAALAARNSRRNKGGQK